MNQQSMRNLTLFDLLARNWQRPSAVEDLRFSADGSVLAFACADGSIAIARLADQEPPESRIRVSADLGQATIRPRKDLPGPLVTTAALGVGAPPIATFGQSDFIVGTSDGKVFHVTAAGDVEDAGIDIGAAVVAIDHAQRTGLTATSDGTEVFLARMPGGLSRLGLDAVAGVAALAFSPSGRQLAVSHADGVSIWTIDGDAVQLCKYDLPGRPTSLSWRADGGWLACPMQSGGFGLVDLAGGRVGTVAEFPAQVRAASWSGPANALVASGAFRIAGWSMATPPLDGDNAGALVTGRAGVLVVETVAAHPQKPLAAAGYANGQIVVAQIGARDELLVKPSGGSVTVLAWSANGRHLAAGAADGAASIITFPPLLFK